MGPAEVIEGWFAAQDGLAYDRTGDRSWYTVLSGEHKRTIPVSLQLGTDHLLVESFFMAAPDENVAEVYAFLLRRNLRTYTFRFALDERGDVLLVGLVPLAAVSEAELDRMLGQLLLAADDAYNQALRTGFAAYIDREQAWRAKVGAPRNPIT